MKAMLYVLALAMGVTACAQFRNVHPELIETQAALVEGCRRLGTISETANADYLSDFMARQAMENRVRERAVQLGATHLVWLHRTPTSAAAQAFACSP